MKRWSLILCCFLCSLFANAEKRALVIGIGNYPDVDYGWHSINGDNDIPLVCEMLEVNGFSSSNIVVLRDAQATYKGILTAFNKLKAQSKTGDIIYIHFSGHGQQITDLDGDEEEGYDEAWIPYDALQEPTPSYHGEKHLTDDRLNEELLLLRKKVGAEGRIIVVSDACHSGTGTRQLDDTSIIRGSSAKFIIPKPSVHRTQPKPIEWISISACADKECNRQTKTPEGEPCGSLSYALYLMRSNIALLTADQLIQRLKQQLQPPFIARPQTPQAEYPATMKETKLFQ